MVELSAIFTDWYRWLKHSTCLPMADFSPTFTVLFNNQTILVHWVYKNTNQMIFNGGLSLPILHNRPLFRNILFFLANLVSVLNSFLSTLTLLRTKHIRLIHTIFGRSSKRTRQISIVKSTQLTIFRTKTTIDYENQLEVKNRSSGWNFELLNIKPSVAYDYHCRWTVNPFEPSGYYMYHQVWLSKILRCALALRLGVLCELRMIQRLFSCTKTAVFTARSGLNL
jgi:hypothetical protein